MSISSLLIEASASGAVVLSLSFLAEVTSPRVAGILSGAPMGAVLVYFFVGREAGTEVIVASIPHAIAGLSATLAFVCAYQWGAFMSSRFSVLSAIFAGLAAFGTIAGLLSYLALSIAPAIGLTVTAAIAAHFYLNRSSHPLLIHKRTKLTVWHVMARTGSSALFVVLIINLATVLGPVWKGLLVGFPMNLLPLLVIIHITYDRGILSAMVRNFPIGVFSLFVYLLSLPMTLPVLGLTGGILASLGFAYLYQMLLVLAHRLH